MGKNLKRVGAGALLIVASSWCACTADPVTLPAQTLQVPDDGSSGPADGGAESGDDAGMTAEGGPAQAPAPQLVQPIAAGEAMTCGVAGPGATTPGAIMCWGANTARQLGLPSSADVATSIPAAVSSAPLGATGISIGWRHACAVFADRTVRCWGVNGHYALGKTSGGNEAALVAGLVAPVSVAAGFEYTCALEAAGSVKCWGLLEVAQGSTPVYTAVPQLIPYVTSARSIAVSGQGGCAVLADGAIRCWHGRSAATFVPGVAHARSVTLTGGERCALLDDQSVRCWGAERTTGTYAIAGLSNVTGIAASDEVTCTISAGRITCWGSNVSGILGDAAPPYRTPALVAIPDISNATSISVSKTHACAGLADGTSRCWGDNAAGQLGDGVPPIRNTPVLVPGLSGVTSLSGSGDHVCAITGGVVQCWGANYWGQLGSNATTRPSSTPSARTGITNATLLSTNVGCQCALRADDTVTCWAGTAALGGNNCWGFATDGNPVNITGLAGNVVALESNQMHACALVDDGTVWCWGHNPFGQLGDGTDNATVTPVRATVFTGSARSLTTGGSTTCVTLLDGTVSCWGASLWASSFGGIFQGPATLSLPVGNALSVVHRDNVCALGDTGGVFCWGNNDDGQLGDGTTTPTLSPLYMPSAVPRQANVGFVPTSLALTDQTSCAVSAGAVKCWGGNGSDQLGSGQLGGRALLPVTVSGVTGAVSVAGGRNHACALLANGTVMCWGDDSYGQMGVGRILRSATPLAVVFP